MTEAEIAKMLLDEKSCIKCWYRSYRHITEYEYIRGLRNVVTVCLKTGSNGKITCSEWRSRYE